MIIVKEIVIINVLAAVRAVVRVAQGVVEDVGVVVGGFGVRAAGETAVKPVEEVVMAAMAVTLLVSLIVVAPALMAVVIVVGERDMELLVIVDNEKR